MALELTGTKELQRKLKKLGLSKSKKSITGAVRNALLPAKKMAQATAPQGSEPHRTHKGRLVAPGFLSRSLTVTAGVDKDGVIRARLGPKSEAFYGTQFVELGTEKMGKQPWLEPAFDAMQNKVVKRYGVQLRRLIVKNSK